MGIIKTLAVVGGGAYALSELSKQQTANRSANVTVKSQIDPLAVKEAIAKDPTLLQLVRGEKGEKGDTGQQGPVGNANTGDATFVGSRIVLPNNGAVDFNGTNKRFRAYNDSNVFALTSFEANGTIIADVLTVTSAGVVSKIGGGSFSAISDERVKSSISDFEKGLLEVLAIETKTFKYKKVKGTQTENYPDFICNKTQYGVIAQQFKEVCPEMVTQDEQGFYSVDLSNLPLMLVNAVKELNAKLETVTANYEALLQRIEALETPPATA